MLEITNYIINEDTRITERDWGGRAQQSVILTYDDDTKWVQLKDKEQERFCGFLYLENALKEQDIQHIKAAPNKLDFHYEKSSIYPNTAATNDPISLNSMPS